MKSRRKRSSRRKGGCWLVGADSRSPLQSYHWPLSSLDMWSCVRRRTHSSSLVWKNSTGSLRRLHHSQLMSSDARRHTFSKLFRSAPAGRAANNTLERERGAHSWRFSCRQPPEFFRGESRSTCLPSVSSWIPSTANCTKRNTHTRVNS